jgi:5-formyltetrahydrofolate cyclo-ligase
LRRVIRTGAYRRARRIGAYWPLAGELDTRPLLARILIDGKQAFLPAMAGCPSGEMRWRPFRNGMPARRVRHGVLEPLAPREWLEPWRLDLVIVPLVAVDTAGNRLGMGAGYYDRGFAFVRRRRRRPVLMGVAYGFQSVNAVASEPWDVPLDEVVTDDHRIKLCHAGATK